MANTSPLGGSGGIPSDFASNSIPGSRRIKTSSQDSVNTATINGLMNVISRSLTIAPGEEVGMCISVAGETLVGFVYADSLDVKFLSSVSGTLSDLGFSKSLNLSKETDYVATYEYYTDAVYDNLDVIFSKQAPVDVALFTNDFLCFAVINNTGETVTTQLSVGLESNGAFDAPQILRPNTEIIESTEMSQYG